MSHKTFYSKDEFESQYQDYINQGLTPAQALRRVQQNEEEDREEYERWKEETRQSVEEWSDE